MNGTDDETEAREEYFMIVSQIFDSEEQGYEHYNRYANWMQSVRNQSFSLE
jgi:hypothetical protein